LCAENMPDGGFALGLQTQARQADPTVKEKQEYKEGIYKRRKAKTQP
jgi:hypothetical protein